MVARDSWVVAEIAPHLFLSRCPSLPGEETPAGVVLGLAFPSRSDGREPESWSGRFVLLDEGSVRLDFAGTLGVFYRRVNREVWISSSPDLLRRIEPELDLPRERLRWHTGREWFSPPSSGIEGIARLLPSQRLGLVDARLESRRLIPPIPSLSVDEALVDASERLRRIVREMAKRFPLWLPLTAGKDSRLLLAVCAAEGLPIVTFTLDRPPAEDAPSSIARADRELPPRLAAAVGYEHRLIATGPVDLKAVAVFDDHTALHSDDLDRYAVRRGQWEAIPTDVLVLGGHVFEVGIGYYDEHHHPEPPREWLDWIEQTPSELGFYDRLMLEQRIAGWLSSYEQGVDATGRRRVHVANCAELQAAVFALPERKRQLGRHQLELASRLAPELAEFPVNPYDSTIDRLRARISRERNVYQVTGGIGGYLGHRLQRVRTRRESIEPAQ
jgi:hypothetical protein